MEGRSSFAVEMEEMRFVLQDVTNRSLVLVDELGKGTEAKAGAALAGAIMEELDTVGCKGIFATHLHSILDMELELPGTKNMMMEITGEEEEEEEKKGRKRFPTWRMVPGSSTESLALEVAAECRLPPRVVGRAAELYDELNAAAMNGENELLSSRSRRRRSNDTILQNERSVLLLQNDITTASIDKSQASRASSLHSDPSDALKSAGKVLQETTWHVMAQYMVENQDDVDVVQFVPSGMQPPARTVGASCVYIARRHADGWFYVGTL